jgi:hypothetical protein
MNTSAVNEFLAQMNNSGDDGVFIILATKMMTMTVTLQRLQQQM